MEERASLSVEMAIYEIPICMKENGIFSPEQFLFTFELLLPCIHRTRCSAPAHYANVFVSHYVLTVNENKGLFILIFLKHLN